MTLHRLSAALWALLFVLVAAGAAQAGNPHGTPPGQAKQSPTAQSTSAPGVKPDSTTQHETSCSTGGGQGTAATCGSSTSSNPDASKRYGNGKTAAQIANSRGAPAGTQIKGPGNSQPHKVCKNGHWVDVHAVKSYAASTTCTPAAPTNDVEQSKAASVGSCTCTSSSTSNSSNTSVSSSNTSSSTSNTSSSSTNTSSSSSNTSNSSVTTSSSSSNTSNSAVTQATSSPATSTGNVNGLNHSSPASSSSRNASPSATAPAQHTGVLGASHTLSRPAASLVSRVLRATLPFTGLPLWVPLLLGLALLAGGAFVLRTSRETV